MSTSRELIAGLRAAGWNLANIGRAVGRDSSLISQIEKGKKPGANLAGALSELLSGKPKEQITQPERRRAKSGEVAKVREGAKAKAERQAREEAERQAREEAERKAREAEEREQARLEKLSEKADRRLERFDPGTKVVIRVTTKDGNVITLGAHGGIDVDAIRNEGGVSFAAGQAGKQNYGLDESDIFSIMFEDYEDFA